MRDVYHKSFFQLTVCPVRQEHLTDLLTEAGFQNVKRYGDFQANYDFYDPDFIIQGATSSQLQLMAFPAPYMSASPRPRTVSASA